MSNISARLSADNSNFRSVMDQSATVAEKAGQRMGRGLDIRGAVSAMAVAVGLNIQNLAQQLARAFTGMSKEAEEAIKGLEASSRRAAEANIANMRSMASEEAKYQLLLLERERIQKRLAEGRMSPDAQLNTSWLARAKAGLGAFLGRDWSGQLTDEIAVQQTNDANEQTARLADLSREIAAAEEKRAAAVEKTLKVEEKIKPIKEARVATEEDIAAAMARQAAEAARQLEIEQNLQKLKDKALSAAIFAMTSGTLGAGDVQRAGTDALAEMMRRLQNDLQLRNANPAASDPNNQLGTFFGNLSIQNDLARIRAELDLRRNLQRDVDRHGIEGARRRFDGDPLAFDRLVAEFATARDKFTETNQLLREMNDRQRRGLTVVTLNPPGG
jgi:hypothetical protein